MADQWQKPYLPLVGRDDELQRLLRSIEHAPDRLTLVSGEPGIGKSRLLVEAGARPRTFDLDVSPLRGRTLVYAGTNDLGLQAPGAIEKFARVCDEAGARLELLDGLTHSEGFSRSDLVLPLVMPFLVSQSQAKRDDVPV